MIGYIKRIQPMPSIICDQGQPQPLISKGDLAALAKGFTKRVYIEGGPEEGFFLIHPNTDLDTRFKAWACDWDQWIVVDGYNCMIEEGEA